MPRHNTRKENSNVIPPPIAIGNNRWLILNGLSIVNSIKANNMFINIMSSLYDHNTMSKKMLLMAIGSL